MARRKPAGVRRHAPDPMAELDKIRKNLALLEGRLAVLSRVFPETLQAARLLEALLGLMHPRRANLYSEQVADELDRAATRLRHFASGTKQASGHVRPGDAAGLASLTRDILANALKKGHWAPEVLATIVFQSYRQNPSAKLYPRPPDDPKGWEKVIQEKLDRRRDVARDHDLSTYADHAEALVQACAKAAGHERPSAIFDRERAAGERSDGKRIRRPRRADKA